MPKACHSFIRVNPRDNVSVRTGKQRGLKKEGCNCESVFYDFVVQRPFLQQCKLWSKTLPNINSEKWPNIRYETNLEQLSLKKRSRKNRTALCHPGQTTVPRLPRCEERPFTHCVWPALLKSGLLGTGLKTKQKKKKPTNIGTTF